MDPIYTESRGQLGGKRESYSGPQDISLHFMPFGAKHWCYSILFQVYRCLSEWDKSKHWLTKAQRLEPDNKDVLRELKLLDEWVRTGTLQKYILEKNARGPFLESGLALQTAYAMRRQS